VIPSSIPLWLKSGQIYVCFQINYVPESPKTNAINLALFRGTKHCNSGLHSRAQVGFQMIEGVFWDIDPPQNFASQQCSWSSSERKLKSTECLLGYQVAQLQKTLTALLSRHFQVLSKVVLVLSQLFFPGISCSNFTNENILHVVTDSFRIFLRFI
jgi:hypothetical protein